MKSFRKLLPVPAVLLAALLLCACGTKEQSAATEQAVPTLQHTEPVHPQSAATAPDTGEAEQNAPFPEEYAPGKELLCYAGTREEAEKVAGLYGIELVSFGNKIAVFHTEEDPYAVIRRGTENGFPALEINHVVKITGTEGGAAG